MHFCSIYYFKIPNILLTFAMMQKNIPLTMNTLISDYSTAVACYAFDAMLPPLNLSRCWGDEENNKFVVYASPWEKMIAAKNRLGNYKIIDKSIHNTWYKVSRCFVMSSKKILNPECSIYFAVQTIENAFAKALCRNKNKKQKLKQKNNTKVDYSYIKSYDAYHTKVLQRKSCILPIPSLFVNNNTRICIAAIGIQRWIRSIFAKRAGTQIKAIRKFAIIMQQVSWSAIATFCEHNFIKKYICAWKKYSRKAKSHKALAAKKIASEQKKLEQEQKQLVLAASQNKKKEKLAAMQRIISKGRQLAGLIKNMSKISILSSLIAAGYILSEKFIRKIFAKTIAEYVYTKHIDRGMCKLSSGRICMIGEYFYEYISDVIDNVKKYTNSITAKVEPAIFNDAATTYGITKKSIDALQETLESIKDFYAYPEEVYTDLVNYIKHFEFAIVNFVQVYLIAKEKDPSIRVIVRINRQILGMLLKLKYVYETIADNIMVLNTRTDFYTNLFLYMKEQKLNYNYDNFNKACIALNHANKCVHYDCKFEEVIVNSIHVAGGIYEYERTQRVDKILLQMAKLCESSHTTTRAAALDPL